MTGRRQRWEAFRCDTGESVSAGYYVAAPAYKVAQTAADIYRCEVEVRRNGQVYKTFAPEGEQTTDG